MKTILTLIFVVLGFLAMLALSLLLTKAALGVLGFDPYVVLLLVTSAVFTIYGGIAWEEKLTGWVFRKKFSDKYKNSEKIYTNDYFVVLFENEHRLTDVRIYKYDLYIAGSMCDSKIKAKEWAVEEIKKHVSNSK